jgi:hypothetical protein
MLQEYIDALTKHLMMVTKKEDGEYRILEMLVVQMKCTPIRCNTAHE